MISAVLLAWVVVVAVVALRAHVGRRACSPGPSATRLAPADVLVLRPCAGKESSLEEALTSTSAAPVDARIRFLLARGDDPAADTCRVVAAGLREAGRDAEVLITGAAGPNRKVEQLAVALEHEQGSACVLVADSDVALSDALIASLLEPLARNEADCVWAPPVETRPSTSADRAGAAILDGSLHAFGLLAELDPAGMVGKAFAVRPPVLQAVGGMRALAAFLGEDMELSRRLRTQGFRVAPAGTAAVSLARGRSWGELVARYRRWLLVLRAQRPWLLVSYPLLLAALPLQLLLGGAALWRDGARALPPLAVAIAVRLAIAAAATRRGRRRRAPLLDLLAADVVLLLAWVGALARRSFSWRGTRLRLGRDGALREVGP